jgi:hypothetical protein
MIYLYPVYENEVKTGLEENEVSINAGPRQHKEI